MRKVKYTYELNQLNQAEIIILTHLGFLGDHIVCNGMINYLSQRFDVIYLPVKRKILRPNFIFV